MTDSLPRFAVLLAAYNGEQWIASQIDSILQQQSVALDVYVSLDNCTDNTKSVVERLALVDARVKLLSRSASAGGAAANFFSLFRDVDYSKYDYVALSDQDDLWHPWKLARAHEVLSHGPYRAYSSNVEAFWPDARSAFVRKSQRQRRFDYLFEAAGPGCTYVLTASCALMFKDFLLDNWEAIRKVSLHDWLIYAWCRSRSFPWYIDELATMRYRQHTNNQVGVNSGAKAFRARLKLLRSGWYRGEIMKIARLIKGNVELPSPIIEEGRVPLFFFWSNFLSFRRRLRDSMVLAVIITLGIY